MVYAFVDIAFRLSFGFFRFWVLCHRGRVQGVVGRRRYGRLCGGKARKRPGAASKVGVVPREQRRHRAGQRDH